jgi:hypothetical protein
MNLYPFLRRLRREAIPPVLTCDAESAWAWTEPESSVRPNVPWRLSEQDVQFLRRRLHIDPDR